MEEISKKVQERWLKRHGYVVQHYVGGRVVGMEVQWRRKRGRPKVGWTDDIRKKGLSGNVV